MLITRLDHARPGFECDARLGHRFFLQACWYAMVPFCSLACLGARIQSVVLCPMHCFVSHMVATKLCGCTCAQACSVVAVCHNLAYLCVWQVTSTLPSGSMCVSHCDNAILCVNTLERIAMAFVSGLHHANRRCIAAFVDVPWTCARHHTEAGSI